MTLTYNIYFELSAAFFLMILFIYLRIQYGAKSRVNKAFTRLILFVLIADVLDVVTAVTISYSAVIPLWVNTLLNTIYLITDAFLGFHFLYYSNIYVAKEKQRSRLLKINQVILISFVTIMLINPFTGWVFYMSDTQGYVHGPLYYIVFAIPFYFVISSAAVMLASFDRFERMQRISIIIYTILASIGPFIQMVFIPNVLFGMFTISLGIMMMVFSLETPDYQKLMRTMEELERTKEEAERAKEEAEKAREDALAANRAKSRFLANMSHEIRTPINAVLGMNELIIRESCEEAIRSYAQDIENSGRMLLALINDILDFSKIEAGKMEIIPIKYDMCNLISNCYDMIYVRAREKNLELIIENEEEIPRYLYGDVIRIQQIIVNLLTNAVKYTARGSVTLKVEHEKLDEKRIFLKIAVKDTGIGIREEDQKKLFETFRRIEEKKNRSIEGAGLGLSITKQLVDMMEGTLWVESVYELGSVFSVSIPQEIVSAETAGNFATEYMYDRTVNEQGEKRSWPIHGRILAVDDMEMNLKVITGLLKGSGLQIDTAGSGKKCIEMVKEKKYDMIFMDHMMPEMDGIETLHKIREMEEYPNADTPVIMLTANAIAGVKEEYLAEGFCDYLSKPVRGSELEQMVLKYMNRD